jgi:NAD(P)H-hydrate epimerase
MERIAALPTLPPRAADSHKGDYGRVLCIGGSRGMAGAVSLAGMAALRSGAGLVTLAVPDVCLETVASFEPSYMTLPLPCDGEGRFALAAREGLLSRAATATAVAVGPGLGRSDDLTELVLALFAALALPAVFDADALFALAQRPSALARHAGPRILTPHGGELVRLAAQPLENRQSQIDAAHELAARCEVVVLLKGHESVVTDGRRYAVNATGNPGMATGGAGDVLTGVVAALLGQGLPPFDAAQLGAHVHGRAGDLAAAELGQTALIAGDLVRFLPQAFAP